MVKIAEYLKIVTDEEVKNFLRINFGEYFKSTRKKLYSKLIGEKIYIRKVVELFYSFLTEPGKVEKYIELIAKNVRTKNYYQVLLITLNVNIILSFESFLSRIATDYN